MANAFPENTAANASRETTPFERNVAPSDTRREAPSNLVDRHTDPDTLCRDLVARHRA